MVFVFGVDVPLVELILTFSVITLIVLVEVTVVMIILLYQMRHSKEVTRHLEKMSRTLLSLEKEELKALKRTKRRR